MRTATHPLRRARPLLPLLLLLAGCAGLPSGPGVAVMPAPGKPLDLFNIEDRQCRNYADQAIGIAPRDIAVQNMTSNVVFGTAVGAAVGGLAGGNQGAATGAAVGMVAGTASGASQASATGYDAQRRYDIAYLQCMYAKGNHIPGYGYRAPAPGASGGTPYYYPPPPPTAPPR